MEQTSVRLLTILGIIMLLFTACSQSDFTVKGTVSGADGQTMFLENVGISSVNTLDSVKLTPAGKFNFKQPRSEYPEFYRLRLNNQWINFSIDSTETVTFSADAGTFATSYIVEGSENSRAIKTITLAQLDANQAIDRLRKEYKSKLIPDTIYHAQVAEVAHAYKNVARKYIFSAPMSAVAYFALFQTIDGLLFFDLYDKDDSKAYGAVATSYDFSYPNSVRARHLHNLALQSIKVIRQQRSLSDENINIQEVSYMDISLPDYRGGMISLSSIAKNNTVLINFTAYQSEWSASLNMDLVELHERYKSKGFVIYQVSLDTDSHFWRNVSSKLPWTCVHDPESVYSQVAALYNVKRLPAFFLLDKKGDLVKKIEDPATLENDIRKSL